MKTLTIKQPFATLIVEGLKEYEFRTWKTNYRGEILIHAGKGVDKKAMKKYEYLGLEYPKGCIIGKATITDCIKIDDNARKILKEKNSIIYSNIIDNKDWNGYGFKLENVEKLENIEVCGKLSFWEFDYPQICGKRKEV
mgnify:FL=1